MAYAANHPGLVCGPTASEPEPTGRRGVLWRVFDAISESRQRSANRDIAQFIARNGGQLTDEVERQLMEQLFPRSSFGER